MPLGTVAMISGQRLSHQAVSCTSLVVRPLNCDEILDKDEDDDNKADPGKPNPWK